MNDLCVNLAKATITASQNLNPLVKQNFGLSCNGIDVVESVERLGNIIFGLSKNMTITDFIKTDVNTILHSCAGNILQFFLVSLDGSIILPIHIFPYTNLAITEVADIVASIRKDFEALIEISWVSTDGEHEGLEAQLEKLNPPLMLFRDTDHVAKSGRNAILKNKFCFKSDTEESTVQVSLNLIEIMKQDPMVPNHIRSSLCTLLKENLILSTFVNL